MKNAVLALAMATSGSAVAAESFVPVKDQATFLSLIDGKQLRNFLLGVQLNVGQGGQIDGEAWGWGIKGTWAWQDGYFCCQMSWGGDPTPYNCQLVEARGDDRLRFTVDRGDGDSALFRLQ